MADKKPTTSTTSKPPRVKKQGGEPVKIKKQKPWKQVW
jgi:hypothetical protein